MKIRNLMATNVETCGPDSDLASVAMIMWRNDCGVVPVVEPATMKTIGMLTDRDICMAVATQHRPAKDIHVRQVMSGRLISVHEDDDLAIALETMRTEQVRRLPVLDRNDVLTGVLSINDLVLAAKAPSGRARADVPIEYVMDTLKAVCAHRPLEQHLVERHPELVIAAR